MQAEASSPPSIDMKPSQDATSSDDAASSLRAAALLTLKVNKRRKPESQATQPGRPIPVDNSVQLDYGQEDTAFFPPEAPSNIPRNDSEDGQIREEGEISDTEAPPLPAEKKTTPPSSPKRNRRASSVSVTVSKVESSPLIDRISDAILSSPKQPQTTSVRYFVDAENVRPGLAMNQEQYDTAKDIVLDLLGWGVYPEYLVDCGLSREIVYYVFSELNLRIPENLNTEGIIPYTPSTLKALLREPNGIGSPLGSESSGQRLPGLISLPPKSSTSGQDRSRKISRGSSVESSGTTALQDMERQRRQELLARKAVQISRKARNPASISPILKPAALQDEDVEMTAAVPTESVDDFLKSIEPSGSGRMDVDETSGGSTPAHSAHQDLMQVDSDRMLQSPSQTSIPTPTEDQSIAFISGQTSSSEDTSGPSNGAQRRNGKRPVAADFVDFDTSPRSRNGSSLKRKSGSFASISTMRRCVIDLSDSDGETDGDVRMKPTPPSVAPSSRVPTPPISSSAPNYPTNSPADLDLAAKEMEIQKMRQMIAEREQGRVKKRKKLEAMSNLDTVVVKQEENELMASLATPANESTLTESSTTLTDTAFSTTPIGNTESVNDRASGTPSTEDKEMTSDNGDDQAATETAQKDLAGTVDVDVASSSSAQRMPDQLLRPPKPEEKDRHPEKPESSATYTSIFDFYPLLRSRPMLQGELTTIATPSSSFSSTDRTNISISLSSPPHSATHLLSFFLVRHLSPSSLPNLRPLRLATASQLLDPLKRICQYEVPGGGLCRDSGCEDIHLSRLVEGVPGVTPTLTEPSDQDTANYLSTVVPDSWITSDRSSLTSRIVAVLEDTRRNYPTLALEERVARVCDTLEPPSATT